MPTSTVRLHRVLRAEPEKISRVHHMDAKVGGTYKMSFTTGHSRSFGGTYLELVPHERIRHTDKFDDPSLPGDMHTTISLKKVFQWYGGEHRARRAP